MSHSIPLQALRATIESVSNETENHGTLIIDGLDFALGVESSPAIVNFWNIISSFRSRMGHLVLSISADGPLLHVPTTSLEQNHQLITTMVAHQSNTIVQLRGLDTGTARDISGILRVSSGGQHDETTSHEDIFDREYLYYVKRDATVRVWSRGE